MNESKSNSTTKTKLINPENKKVFERLTNFLQTYKIPNILFHGNHGCGKKTILEWFIKQLYDDNLYTKTNSSYILRVNCIKDNGIDYIRNQLQLFSKINVIFDESAKYKFKSVILYNADNLTMDAQTALRRCIEIYSNKTRFFITSRYPKRILNPIISRFCNIYVSQPIINGKLTSYYKINRDAKRILTNSKTVNKLIEKHIEELDNYSNSNDKSKSIIDIVEQLIDEGISAIDIVEYMNMTMNGKELTTINIKYEILRKELQNEKFIILSLLSMYILRNNEQNANICLLY